MTDKVWHPYPLDSVAFLGLGVSIYNYILMMHKFPLTEPGMKHEAWTVNAGARALGHDVCFDIHTDEYLEQQKRREYAAGLKYVNRAQNRRKWMKENPGKPIVLAKADPTIPNSYTFPLVEVVNKLNCPYFQHGLAYQIAFAMLCGVKKMQFYGCDFGDHKDEEIESGRHCVEFWLGRAFERGIQIEHAKDTTLMDTNTRQDGHIYGYHEPLQIEAGQNGSARIVGPDYTKEH